MSEPDWTDADFGQYDEEHDAYDQIIEDYESGDPLTLALLATRDD